MFEKDLPGENSTGFSGEAKIGKIPLETCETINGAWGYNSGDKNLKSTKTLLRYLINAAGRNANFLLNIGPKPDGTVQDDFVSRLKEMGVWLGKNGESVYGTRGGPITPRPWGVTTQKGATVYAHVLDWPDPVLPIPRLPKTVKSAKLLSSGQKVEVKNWGDQLLLGLPAGRDEVDTVVVLETA
jgi:alpha-L-fucosidase